MLSLLSTPLSIARPALLRLGGEWAGWCVAFSPATGAVQPVPEKYVSESMIEYDVVPAGFEELTTEAWEATRLSRRSVRLLPEEGCNVENLAAIVTRTSLHVLPGDEKADSWAIDEPAAAQEGGGAPS